MTAHDLLDIASFALPQFCFGYPFVMAWYWMAGGLLFFGFREYAAPSQAHPPALDHWPAISIIVPCYNEAATAEETLTRAAAVDYPDFEIIAVNDGSRDKTAEILDALAARIPNLRVVHLAKNQGKASAMNIGALMARHEIVLCIDGDALLDPQALRWAAHYFLRHDIGGFTGNPRIRNRTSILGRLQVGEFSSIIGLIKRSQSTYGRLFTVSGVICAFRKRALADAGWWSSRTVTDDIDITWRVQLAGWRVIYAPNVMVWILMPETLRGLWSQRLRWAEGGAQMMVDFFLPMVRGEAPSMLPLYINFVISVAWSYLMLFALAMGLLWSAGPGARALHRRRQIRAAVVGAHAGRHLPRAGTGQSPDRAALRAQRGELDVLDHLVSTGVLADQHHHDGGGVSAGVVPQAQRPHDLGQSRPRCAMSERLRRSRPMPEWPPLIVAASVPRWMWWRDFVLTAAVWIVFVWLAVDEYDFMREAYVERYGLPTHTFKSHFPRFLQELRPDGW